MGRSLRVLVANALWAAVGLAAVGAAFEIALRARAPFMSPPAPVVFRPEAGFVKPPDTELRASNNLDYWQVSRVNSLGFLDREPPSPERAAASCHLTILGDSFIEAREVPITSKVQVRLEELAAAERPDLDLTTSAFGLWDTGQVQQLAFFDAYARPLEPKAVVLALVLNGLRNNSSLLRGIRHGWDPERLPQTSARRGPDGAFSLLPPDAGYAGFALDPDAAALPAETPASPLVLLRRAVRFAYLYRWLRAKRGALFRYDAARDALLSRRVEILRRRPEYAELLRGYSPESTWDMLRGFAQPELAPVVAEALDSTAFALREFRRRADETGAVIVGLLADSFEADRWWPDRERALLTRRLVGLAADAGIPVLDLEEEMRRRGLTTEQVKWAHDAHWNPAGHRLAAEVLWRWLENEASVCDGGR